MNPLRPSPHRAHGIASRVLLLLLICCAPSSATRGIYPPVPEPLDEAAPLPLYVGLIESYDASLPDDQLGAVGTVVGAEIALDHINADARMLPGYSLHFNFINSQVYAHIQSI